MRRTRRAHEGAVTMHRLYVQIYVSFVIAILLFGLISATLWWMDPERRSDQTFQIIAGLIGDTLPSPDEPTAELQMVVEKIARRIGVDLTVCGPDGSVLAGVGRPLRPPPPGQARTGWMHTASDGMVVVFRLADGRVLLVRHPHRPGLHVAFIALFAVVLAIATYPVARRIARRLERLRARVEKLATGDLSARVDVEGKDEVACLARSFNRAADRIEQLVLAQRAMLANASHELRSPLARLRMAVELLPGEERPDLRERIAKEIRELDDLIGEILLASRLESLHGVDHAEEVDLLALAAEEAARVDAAVSGAPVRITADPRLLRRLVRNLIENAAKYAPGSPVEVTVAAAADTGAILTVEDRGPGIPEGERERIFEPFYSAHRDADMPTGGSGLGLALVRQIARFHGGGVRCVPRDGGGSRFEVTLRGAVVSDPARHPRSSS